jgi:hypothetical protein
LAFRSLELCSSCDLEVLEGVLGVLASVADLSLLQQRSRGKWVEKLKVFGGVVDGWSGCGCEVRWMDCAVGRLSRGVLRASPFIAVFGCLCCGVEG